MSSHILTRKLKKAYKAHRNTQVADGQTRYLKNQFPFLGLQSPVRYQIQKEIFKAHKLKTERELVKVISELWDLKEREYQLAALDLAFYHKKIWSESIFSVFEKLVTSQSWWDTVDYLATRLIGNLLYKYEDLRSEMNSWIDDMDMWKRRVAILHQLKYKSETNAPVLFGFIRKTMHEREFFIRKAIGWALREYSKTEPEKVRAFIQENLGELSPLSLREGSKYL